MDQVQEKVTRASWKILPMPPVKKRLAFEQRFTESEFEKISQGIVPIKWKINGLFF